MMTKLRIIDYLKMRWTNFILLVIACIMFPFVQYLFGYHVEAVLYSVEMLITIFAVLTIVDYLILKYKHNKLQERIQNLSVYSTHKIIPTNLLEKDYEDTIEKLYEMTKDIMNHVEVRYKNQIEYFTMWVHQIKTPISAMTLLVDDEQIDPTIRNSIRQEIFKVEQYASMVLEYLRIDNMSQDLILSPYELDSIVKKCVKKFSTIFIHKHNSLEIKELSSTVKTDERWLLFLLEQVLSNALKYTNQGTIRIYEETALNNRIALVIEDTGIGIKEEDIPRIFEQGYTGFNGRMNQKATGIGLYLSKKVADKLSCKIQVSSKVRVGTKITIIFPSDDLEVF